MNFDAIPGTIHRMGMRSTTAAREDDAHVPGETGIWIMIFGDMLIFGIMFVAFLASRRQQSAVFEASRLHLNQHDGLLNTLFMLTSSWCVARAVQSAKAGRPRTAALRLRLGLGCGFAFCIVKIFEYGEKFRAGIAIDRNDFYTYYYAFTGIHLLHVLIGMGVLVFTTTAVADPGNARRIGHLESGASFWHLVDLLWVALFVLLYLLPGAAGAPG